MPPRYGKRRDTHLYVIYQKLGAMSATLTVAPLHRRHIVPSLAVLALGAIVLVAAVFARGAEYDEQYTMQLVAGVARPAWPLAAFTGANALGMRAGSTGLVAMARDLRATDVHPPLYFWAASLWREMFGPGLERMRLMSALFALSSLVVVGQIARSARIRPALPMLFTVGCYGFVYTGAIARGFALAQLLTLCGVALLLRAEGRRDRLSALAGGLALGAASFSNYLSVFVAGAALLWLVIRQARSRGRRSRPGWPGDGGQRADRLAGEEPVTGMAEEGEEREGGDCNQQQRKLDAPHLFEEPLPLEPGSSDGGDVLAVDGDLGVQGAQRAAVQRGKGGGEQAGDRRIGVDGGLADDRAGFVDLLSVFGVLHEAELERGDGAVGAVGHGGVDAGGAFGGGALGGGGVAAGQDDELSGGEFEAVGGLEGGQGGRALDELGGRGELDVASWSSVGPAGEVLHRLQLFLVRNGAVDRDPPGVLAGAGGSQSRWLASASSLWTRS